MQNAAVFFVTGGNEAYRRSVHESFRADGHQVVLEATNFEEALGVINGGQLQEKKVNVAMIEDYLPQNGRADDILVGRDVSEKIRNQTPSVKILRLGFFPASIYSYGDVYLGAMTTTEDILQVIASL